MTTMTFGHDLPDTLLLSNWSDINFLQNFYIAVNSSSNSALNFHHLCKGILFNDQGLLKRSQYNYKLVEKNDDYYFEQTIKSYRGDHKFYIIRNKKWYVSTNNYEYLLIPCEGEHADLSGIQL